MIEYVRREHWMNQAGMTAYDVIEDGVLIGRIERAVESTDRHYGRIRVPGKGRLAWAWRRTDGVRNGVGLYELTREAAVERMKRA